MNNSAQALSHTCPSCGVTSDESVLGQSEYRCPKCSFEMAHLDTAPNGSVRGVFGYLLSVDEKVQDRYLIQSVLGKGGFGATYLVEDLKLKGKRRALKEVPELLFDEHEVNLLSQLSHPTIPDIIDRFISGKMVYLILEFGGRQTLGSECRRVGGRLPLARSVNIMRQLCDALTYLHAQDPAIIHRDLKPDNVLLDDNDRIMLIDFGIAKESTQGTTRMMARAASHGFSPPEQVLGTGTDERSDIYSFGATLYYVLTGQIPAAAHERVAGKELIPPSKLIPGLPPEIDEIILSTLNLNLNQRPGRIGDLKVMLDALSDLAVPESPHSSQTVRIDATAGGVASKPGTTGSALSGIKLPASKPAPEKSPEAPLQQKRNPAPVIAIALALVLALAVGAFFLLREKKPEPVPTAAAPADPAAPLVPAVQPGQPGQAAEPVKAEISQPAVVPGEVKPFTGTGEATPAIQPKDDSVSAQELLQQRLSEQNASSADAEDKGSGSTAGKKPSPRAVPGKGGVAPPARKF